MVEISEETKVKIEYGLKHWSDPDSEARKRFESAREYWDKVIEPLKRAIEESERLTARDYMIRINVRDDYSFN